MAVRGVVRHEVQQHPQAAPMRLGDQRVEVGEGAEARVDVAVVGDVVPPVGHRRGVDRRQPEGVDAEPLQVVEPRQQAAQVAPTVAVGVLERQRVDLVDHPALPPGVLLGRHHVNSSPRSPSISWAKR